MHDHESIIAFHSAIHKENTYERRFELRPILRNVTEFDSFVTEKIGAEIKLTSPSQKPLGALPTSKRLAHPLSRAVSQTNAPSVPGSIPIKIDLFPCTLF